MRDTNYLTTNELEFTTGLTAWLNDHPDAQLAVEIRLIDANGDLVGYVDVLPTPNPRTYGYYPAVDPYDVDRGRLQDHPTSGA